MLREIVSAALEMTVGSWTIRRDECDVGEDGGEDDAGHKDNHE